VNTARTQGELVFPKSGRLPFDSRQVVASRVTSASQIRRNFAPLERAGTCGTKCARAADPHRGRRT
jgi:hypothetical protein